MKVRSGFVANSSSSSFIIMEANNGKQIIEQDMDELEYIKESMEETDSTTFTIDELIGRLNEAKEKGATSVTITYGSYYC